MISKTHVLDYNYLNSYINYIAIHAHTSTNFFEHGNASIIITELYDELYSVCTLKGDILHDSCFYF